jgi:zinc-ribbon domain
MNCPYCNAPVDRDAVFCGNCGHKLVPKLAPGVTVAEATQQVSINERTSYAPGGNNSPLPPTMQPSPVPTSGERSYSSYIKSPGQAGLSPNQTPPPQMPPPDRQRTRRTIFLIGTLVLLVIVASGALVALLQNIGRPGPTTNGTSITKTKTNAGAATGGSATALFSDSILGQGMTDTVKISTSGVLAPAAGMQYNAWIVDNANEHITPLGVLKPDQAKTYSLTYTDQNHQDLLGMGSELRITEEKQGTVAAIAGNIVLSAQMPTGSFLHIRHLLLAFPTTPQHIGLLVGTHEQISLLFAQASNLKTSSDQNNRTAVQCYSQAIIDIIEGSQGSHAKPLDPACTAMNVISTGDGFGLIDTTPGGQNGYLALAAAHAGFAAQAKDATATVKTHSKDVQICIANIQGWVKDMDGDAQTILTNNNASNQITEIGQRANLALNGTDLDNDGSVDPVPGEGGATTAYAHGQLMATLLLAPQPN